MNNNSDIRDPEFLAAVECIDSGDIEGLEQMIDRNPRLISAPLDHPNDGYFTNPYLLWFVADNPIRIDRLSPRIVDLTRMLIRKVKELTPGTSLDQLNYALALLATGRIPRESGNQMELIDLFIDAGAKPSDALSALAHGNKDASAHLVNRGSALTLGVAVGLDRMEDVRRLAESGSEDERLTALTTAAFFGNTRMISYLLDLGTNPNGYPKDGSGFHTHATPLHQAVFSGSLEAVQLLVRAGARLDLPDKVYNGSPIGWAMYMHDEESPDEAAKKRYMEIFQWLKSWENG
jgi:peptide-methionine (S)-S-oxide reductase